jgi:hypothetical protein
MKGDKNSDDPMGKWVHDTDTSKSQKPNVGAIAVLLFCLGFVALIFLLTALLK